MIDLIHRSGGVVRTRGLIAAGATHRDLARAVAGEAVLRVREGVLALPSTDPSVMAAARHGGELACVSALRAHGVWVLDAPGRVHVWLGGKGRRHVHPSCTCVDHHDAGLATFGVVPVAIALIQMARCCSDESFFASYESAWNQGFLRRIDREHIRQTLPAGWGVTHDNPGLGMGEHMAQLPATCTRVPTGWCQRCRRPARGGGDRSGSPSCRGSPPPRTDSLKT